MADVTMGSTASGRYLVADVGGTNARFAIAESVNKAGASEIRLIKAQSFAVSQFENFEDAISQYLSASGLADHEVSGASLAVASAVGVGEIRFTNSSWRFSRESLAERFRFPRLLIVNDFEALAVQIPYSPLEFMVRCRSGEEHPRAPRVVVGPGTGLGVAGLVPGRSADGLGAWIVIPGEGGHIAFAPASDLEVELLGQLRAKYGRVSIERVASGPGLSNIYDFLSRRSATEPLDRSPDSVAKRALAKSDSIAVDAVKLFLGIVGSFAGDAAMMYGARGGVFLGGGILPKLIPAMSESDFFGRFNDKGRHSNWMEKIPISLIVSEQAALLGAALALQFVD